MAGEYKEAILNIKENFKQDNESIKNEDLLNDLTELLLDEVNQNFDNGTFVGHNADLFYGESNLALFRRSMYLAKLGKTSFGDNLIIGYWVAPSSFRKKNPEVFDDKSTDIDGYKFCYRDMILIGRRVNNEKGYYIKSLHLDEKGQPHYHNYDLDVAFRRDGKTVMFGHYKDERNSRPSLVERQNAKLVLSDISENELAHDHSVALSLLNELYIQIMSQDPKMKLDLMSFLFNEEFYENRNSRTCEKNNSATFTLPYLGRD